MILAPSVSYSHRQLAAPRTDYNSSGHPSDSLGKNGDQYTRSDRDGWIYRKQNDVWSLREVGLNNPDPFGSANTWYWCDPYPSFTGQRGDQQTNGKSFNPYSISALGNDPNNASGADGTNNIQQVIDSGSKKALLFRLQELDADTGGAGASRTMARYLSDALCSPAWTDENETRITLRMYTNYVHCWAVKIPTALYNYCYTTKPGMQNVLWQIHDNSVGTSLSPNFEFRLGGRTDASMGKTVGDVRISFATRYATGPIPGMTQAHVTSNNFGDMLTVVPDTWLYFIVESRLAYLAENNPLTRVHCSVGDGAWTTTVDSTLPNAFPADHPLKGIDFDHYWTFGQYIFTPSLLDPGVILDAYFKTAVVSQGGYSPTSDDLDDIKQWMKAR